MMVPGNARRIALFASLLVVLLLSASATADDRRPILVGATVSLEGKFKQPSFMVANSFKLWEKQVNVRGGLLNRPVKLILYDDKSRQDLASHYYRKLVTEDNVDLVLSPYGTPLTLVASEITESRGKVMLACAASGEEIWQRGYKYVFGVYEVSGRYFVGFLDLAARNGMQTVAVVNEDSSFARSAAAGSVEWTDRFGLKVVLQRSYQASSDELSGIVDEIVRLHPDALVFCGYPPQCYKLLRLMNDKDYRPKAIGLTIAPALPDFAQKLGSIAQGIFGPSQWEPDERIPFPGTKKFIREFKAFSGELPSYHAGSAYASCQILERAITRTGQIDNDAIRNYILSLDTVTVIGRFKVDHTGKQIGHNSLIIQWQSGRKQIVYPTRMRTAPAQFPEHSASPNASE